MKIHTLIAELKEIQVDNPKARGEIWVGNPGQDMRMVKHIYLDDEGDVIIVTKRGHH